MEQTWKNETHAEVPVEVDGGPHGALLPPEVPPHAHLPHEAAHRGVPAQGGGGVTAVAVAAVAAVRSGHGWQGVYISMQFDFLGLDG